MRPALAQAMCAVVATACVAPGVHGGAALSDDFPRPGEWTCYRANGRQDAHSPLKGRIAQPRIAWKEFVGTEETWSTVTPGSRRISLEAPPGQTADAASPLADPRWGVAAARGEIEGGLRSIPRTTGLTYAQVLPGESGLQKIEFESAFSKPTRNGDWAHDCVGRCFAWRNGRWEQVWESAPIDALFMALPLVGDFDGDGAPEVAVLPWKELLILDARTGKVKDRCVFTEGRSYGSFGAYDLDADGKREFVVQADFSKHVDVLGYRDGRLSLLWKREIEMDISNPQKILRVNPDPVGDVDGDGRGEVLVSTFNLHGDGKWRLTVHDGMTGTIKADLLDEYLAGTADLDGRGGTRLLTIHTDGAGVPDYGTIRVYALSRGKPAVLWQRERAAWQMWSPQPPANVNTAATLGLQRVLSRTIRGSACVVVSERDSGQPGGVVLTAMRWTGRTFESMSQARGRGVEAVGIDAAGALLVRSDSAPGRHGRIRCVGGSAEAIALTRRGAAAGTVVVVQAGPPGRPTIVAQSTAGSGELVVFQAPSESGTREPPVRTPGRGQSTNWPGEALGAVAADLAGDGKRQLLYASAAPSGCARLVAAGVGGREAWHHDFPAIPGTPPVWNTGGIILWQTGHFTDRKRRDVVVTVRRSMMHSEETYLLSGRDGHEVWRRDRQGNSHSRGVGGTPFAIADYDGDGLEDLALLHPSDLLILNGRTGRSLIERDATWSGVPAKPVYWGIPVAVEVGGAGKPGIFFGTTRRSMTGLVRADGALAWWDALDKSATCLAGFGDFTGAGRAETVGVGFDDGIRCYDLASGKVLWTLAWPVAASPAGTASADINSDGRDEALIAAGDTLYCVGSTGHTDRPQGQVLWQLAFPCQIGPPTVADVDGHGTASILVAGSDGHVYCVR